MDEKLVVKDEEYQQFAQNVVGRTEHVETTLQAMLDLMDRVAGADGALEGDMALNFASFVETVKALKGKVGQLGTEYQTLSTEVVAKIDEADQDIY